MKRCEGMALAAILAVITFASPSACSRSFATWQSGVDGSDVDLSGTSRDSSIYWPGVTGGQGQVPASWLPWTLRPRESRAENFIRFGRSSDSSRTLANKKNNFIRLGRENPRQNNFIRLGRGGGNGGGSEDPPFYFSTGGGGGTVVGGWKLGSSADAGSASREPLTDYGTVN